MQPKPFDEVDVFNAKVLVALAHARRYPFNATPYVASVVSRIFWSLAPKNEPVEIEQPAYKFLLKGRELDAVYARFWQEFGKFVPEKLAGSSLRIVVNSTGSDNTVGVRVDAGLSAGAYSALMVEAGSKGPFDAVVFSDRGIDAAALASLLTTGSTLTFLRPSRRCDFWLAYSGVEHSGEGIMQALHARFSSVEQLHADSMDDAVVSTVYGLSGVRLET